MYRLSQILIGHTVLAGIAGAFAVASYSLYAPLAYGILGYAILAIMIFSLAISSNTQVIMSWQNVVIVTLKTPVWVLKFVVEDQQ